MNTNLNAFQLLLVSLCIIKITIQSNLINDFNYVFVDIG
jgi:hypothetical protein